MDRVFGELAELSLLARDLGRSEFGREAGILGAARREWM